MKATDLPEERGFRHSCQKLVAVIALEQPEQKQSYQLVTIKALKLSYQQVAIEALERNFQRVVILKLELQQTRNHFRQVIPKLLRSKLKQALQNQTDLAVIPN